MFDRRLDEPLAGGRGIGKLGSFGIGKHAPYMGAVRNAVARQTSPPPWIQAPPWMSR